VKLSDLREYVRTQTQTVEAELPNATIDLYLQEAFDRTIAYENQWPFFEKTWQLTQPIDATEITLPGDVNVPAITGLFRIGDADAAEYNYRLELQSHVVAAQMWGNARTTRNRYANFSVWANEIHLWPKTITSDQTEDWGLTGFRRPIDWIALGPETEPDCDERLQQPFAHYAVALAYAQQEDEQLEGVYMTRWQRDVDMARGAIMEPSQDRPLVFGPHHYSRIYPHLQRPFAVVDTGQLP
jgi:hypothetical protein